MALERVVTYRLIRILRVVIPIVVAVLIGIPAWNYMSRRAERAPVAADSQQLPSGVAVKTEGFTFSQTEGGRTLFTVRAKRNLGFKDNRNMLEDVEVIVYGATEAEPTRRIRSDVCSYDQETGDFRFTGAVAVQLDERTTARSEELTYNHLNRTVSSSLKTFLDQPGVVTAEAGRMEYEMATALLKLDGAVHAETAEKTTLDTASAVFNQMEGWATMAGGVTIKSNRGWVRGLTGRADLDRTTFKPKRITIDGNVNGDLQAEGGRRTWRLNSRSLEASISPAGNAEDVRTRGGVTVEEAGGDNRKLTGNEVDATLTADGRIDLLETRGNAELNFGADRKLTSNQIWSNAAGSIETREKSELRIGESVIEGTLFVIQTGDIITFTTPRRAVLRSGDRESSADQTRARFDNRGSRLLELTQTGNFRFKDSRYDGSAQNASFTEGGAVVTLEGSSIVNDSEKKLEAHEVRLNQKDNSFVATKNVRTYYKDAKAPIFVKAGTACRGASRDCKVQGSDALLYTGNVELWRGEDVYIKGDRIEATATGKANKLQADGNVHSTLKGVRASSDKLQYDDAAGVAHYTGSVRAQKQDMILETPDMTVTLRDNTVGKIAASGGVVVTKPGRTGSGEKAEYDAATDSLIVTGKAQVRDKARGTVACVRLIMKSKGDSAVCEGTPGERTVTKYPVKR